MNQLDAISRFWGHENKITVKSLKQCGINNGLDSTNDLLFKDSVFEAEEVSNDSSESEFLGFNGQD